MPLLLDDSIARISKAYADLGYRLGWRFIYGPASTLTCPNGIMLMGTNPGGDQYSVDPTVEAGNAYLVERWSSDGTNLQAQVFRFFEVIARSSLGRGTTAREQLNTSLTTNFCPFRSPTWALLPDRPKAVAFSRQLWSDLLGEITPKLLICMGAPPFPYLESVLRGLGTLRSDVELSTGWGKLRFRVQSYMLGSGGTVLARVPHFSQYRLMSRPNCVPCVQALVRHIEELIAV